MLFVMTGVYIRCIEYAISLGADMTTQQVSTLEQLSQGRHRLAAVFLNSEAKENKK